MKTPGMFGVLHRKIRGLHEAAYLLALFTFVSQLCALVRDRLFAHTFGAGETLDVFYAAFRIPDMMFAILASMVSLFVLIPFIEDATRESDDAVRTFLSHLFTFFTAALSGVAIVVWVFTPELTELLYPAFSGTAHTSLVRTVRILLLQPIILGVSNLCAAYVQVKGRFLLYAIAPVLYNLGSIIGITLLYPHFGSDGLAWGVVLGALLHLAIQVPFLVERQMVPRLIWPNWNVVRKVVSISIPRTITLSAQQFVMLVLVAMATAYGAGSVTAFTLAFNLQAVPLALIASTYSVAAFPRLARLYRGGDKEAYGTIVRIAARQIIFWAIPALVLIVVLRAHMVRVVLGSGAFDWNATMETAALLALLVASLVAQGLTVLLVRACYAAGRTRVPLLLNVGSSIGTIMVAYGFLSAARYGMINLELFAHMMRASGTHGSEVLLIALAFSVGAFINLVLLLLYFEREIPSFMRSLARTSLESLTAALVGGCGTYLALGAVDDMVSLSTGIGVFLQGAIAGGVGLVVWALMLTLLESEDGREAWAGLHTRITRSRLGTARGSIEGV